MTVEPGTRFGSYEVAESIGSGGMGEVYRATDTSLKRDVALKVLPQAFVEDGDRLARFQREAEILASLNHPNIAQVYGLEKADGQTAIVMELVEGPTLADRIAEGPIPPDEAMGIALQVVGALEAAHDKGIVHRDLKPANVKLKDDGTVKVLDFGISKPIDPTAISGGSPMMTTPAVTQTGVILGTAAYMSPEQARGKFVDQRTDVWAFGCLLFEMLTGQPAFGGEDVMLTLARVLDRDTDLSSIPKSISPAVRHSIKLCLEKDPRKRIHHIGDVRLALEGTFESGFPQVAETQTRQPLWKRASMSIAILTAGIAISAFAAWWLWPTAEITRWSHSLREEQMLRVFNGSPNNALAVSPDGRTIVFMTPDGLYQKAMDQFEAQPIAGDGLNNAHLILNQVFYSPDGDSLAFFDGEENALMRLRIGGAAQPIADVGDGEGFFGGSWGPNDMIVYATRNGIYSVVAGGEPRLAVAAEDGEIYRRPQLLPDGDSILVSFIAGQISGGNGLAVDEATQIVVVSLETGDRIKDLFAFGGDAVYVETGHIVYARGDALYGVAFDADSLTLTGDAQFLGEGISRGLPRPEVFFARFAISADGTLAYIEGDPTFTNSGFSRAISPLAWVDQDGTNQELIEDTADRAISDADISPDGDRLVVREFDTAAPSNRALLIADVDNAVLELVYGPTEAFFSDPQFIDEDRVVIAFEQGLALVNVRLGSDPEPLPIEDVENLRPTGFTPERDRIIVRYDGDDGEERIGTVPVDPENGEYPVTPLIPRAGVDNAQVAPQGDLIIYESFESGRRTIYADLYPELDDRQVITDTEGGFNAIFSWSGDAVFYHRDSDDAVMKVALDRTESGIEAGEPEFLFDTEDQLVAMGSDGRLLMSTRSADNPFASAEGASQEGGRIMVIQGFAEILKRDVTAN